MAGEVPTPSRSGAQTPPVSTPPSQLQSPSITRTPMREAMAEEVKELHSIPPTPSRSGAQTPPSQLQSPSIIRTPRREAMAGEMKELYSIPPTPSRSEAQTPPVSMPPSQLQSPTITRTPRFMRTPLASPMKKAIVSMRGYLEDVGHLTKLDPHDAWLPITESRNGNAYYSAFHTLSSGIGFQALVLPVAFTVLGWTWGIFCLTGAFIWQLYTLWLLVHLHESVPGTRYNRYLQLAKAAFGSKWGKILALFPTIYLSAGICSAIVIVGGGSMKLFFNTVCGTTCNSRPLSVIEWYLVFICLAVVIAQLPNLNSIAGVSLIGAATAVTYCTLIWVVSVSKGRQPGVSYDPLKTNSDIDKMLDILNALGIIAFAFRGHNVVLEIQVIKSYNFSTPIHYCSFSLWFILISLFMQSGHHAINSEASFPCTHVERREISILARSIVLVSHCNWWFLGIWEPSSGMLNALFEFHGKDTSRVVLGLTSLLVVINCLSSFQIYAMPVFDNMEAGYTRKNNKPCPRWLRPAFRAFFGAVSFLIAVAFPFLSDLAALMGGIALPVTLAYPCFMWIVLKKPQRYSAMWYINWWLGSLGMGLSVVLVIAGVWQIVKTGLNLRFFKPE